MRTELKKTATIEMEATRHDQCRSDDLEEKEKLQQQEGLSCPDESRLQSSALVHELLLLLLLQEAAATASEAGRQTSDHHAKARPRSCLALDSMSFVAVMMVEGTAQKT